MATSGSTDFSMTRDEYIRDALSLLGVADPNENIDAAILSDCARIFNARVKYWSTKANIWPTVDVTATLTPGDQSYTVGTGLDINTARPVRLMEARRRNTSGTEVPIDVVARSDYMSIPTKSTQGATNCVYYDAQRDNGVLYVWPTGDTSNATLILTFRRPLEDFDSGTNTADFPQELTLMLIYDLADLLQPKFKISDPNVTRIARESRAEALEHDEEHVPFRVVNVRRR